MVAINLAEAITFLMKDVVLLGRFVLRRKRFTQNRNGVTHMFDMKNLTRLKKLDENAPETMKAFWAFDKEAFKAGAIDVLHKQLMAVAVALTTQCP